jgi:hypothetical protein
MRSCRVPIEDWYVRNLHQWVHFLSTVVWAICGLVAVPAWMFSNADKFIGSVLESPEAFLSIGVIIWIAWAYLEAPKIRRAFQALGPRRSGLNACP